ncbi:MAG: type I methionyl aminopeptidase [bacterium]|nr:type I methionyl aminopeptidase [bacterium]
MVHFKTPSEIEIMKEGGKRLRKVVAELIPFIKIGMTTNEIDRRAEDLIVKNGGESSFNKVKNYKWSTCLTINEQVVHTPPSERVIKDGDILTVDIGMYYKGFHTDYADTIAIGNVDNLVTQFLAVGKETLKKAIQIVKIGNRIGHISEVIEDEITSHRYKIMKQLTGHGVGKELHEDPYIFGYRERKTSKTMEIKPGLVIAIEIIYSESCEEIAYEKNNDWSIVTADGSLSACFEHTIAVTDKEIMILT